METLSLLVMAASNIVCFVLGAKVAQALSKGETIKMPNLNPMEAYKAQKAKNKAEKAQSRRDIILQNIDNYNGTEGGQVDVPEG